MATQNITNQEAREVFDSVIEHTADPELRAQRELVREYFTNPEFRRDLADYVHSIIEA